MKYTPDFSSRFRILKGGKISLVVSALLAGSTMSFAAPSGGSVTSGSATINQSGSITTINQSTNKASINWQDFSIGKTETVNFVQPSAQSVTLNRVVGTTQSLIEGAMNANGQVFLLNPNGVLFANGAQVNVGGLVASTLNLSDANFQAGNYTFEGNSQNSIINMGTITANNSYVAMMGKHVANEGTIVATMGNVQLASGEKISLNLNGNSLVKLTIDQGTMDALVENKGLIRADGGQVYLTTQALNTILDSMVNNTGIIEASSFSSQGGKIVLLGDTVVNSGSLLATGKIQGGEIRLVANDTLVNTGMVNAEGAVGGFIAQSASNLLTNLNNFSVASTTGNENDYGWYYIGGNSSYALSMRNPNESGSGTSSNSPTLFNENQGQFGNGVAFGAMGQKHSVVLSAADAAAYFLVNGTVSSIGFNNVNSNLVAVGEDAKNSYSNYYLNGKVAEKLTDYGQVRYKNIYNGVDLVYYTNKNGEIEHDLIISAGANANVVNYKYGANSTFTKLANGDIDISTKGTTITQLAPLTYQTTAKGKQVIASSYETNPDNTVSVKVTDSYDTSKNLVIDPTVSYATYLGGSGDDSGNSVATDSVGNIYFTGYTQSTSGIATAGTFQPSHGGNGNYDAFLVKFDSNGNRVWGTYYGGGDDEEGRSVAIDHSGGIYLAGYTNSMTGIASSGVFQTTFGGGNYDAFLAKFNTSGIREWGTYYGGNGDDEGKNIATDSNGNIYLTGYTRSSSGIATPGAFQVIHGGYDDAFLAKFNTNGNRVWGTYYGGSGSDDGYGIATDSNGNIYIAGTTESTSGIASTGALQGRRDAYLAKFDTNGNSVWGTYYGGSENDSGQDITIDSTGNIYLTGYTRSGSGIATNGAFQENLTDSGVYHAFLTKFNPSGTQLWGTYYAGDANDYAYGVATSSNGNIYVVGETDSENGIVTTGSFQTTSGGSGDAFLVEFDSNGNRIWGTYFGGSDTEFANGVATDSNGNIYVAGYTISTSGIATSGSFQSTYGGGYTDAFVAKFSNPNTQSNSNTSNNDTRQPYMNNIITTIVNSTIVPSPVLVEMVSLSPKSHQMHIQNNVLLQSIMPQGTMGGGSFGLVSMTDGTEASESLTMEELEDKAKKGNIKLVNNEIRVPVSMDRSVELINGGVKLPESVSQQFFVVKGN